MINYKTKQEIKELQVIKLEADRPPLKNSVRKVVFFVLREGPRSTLSKIWAKLWKRNNLDSAVIAGFADGYAAISYDNGEHFYVQTVLPNSRDNWENPFESGTEIESNVKLDFELRDNVSEGLFLIGCGDYSRTYSLTNFKEKAKLGATDYNENILAELERFRFKSNDWRALLPIWEGTTKPIGIIASYHNDHALQASKLFETNNDGYIFVEKPPLVDFESQFHLLEGIYKNEGKIEIGFNRRHAPFSKDAKRILESFDGPTFVSITVNEVQINHSHWYHWKNQGTRITGNGCHWIDLCQFLIDSNPVKLNLIHSDKDKDDCVLIIKYEDGSVVSIFMSDKGNNLRGVQERIEIKKDNLTLLIDDYCSLTVDTDKGRSKKRRLVRDKGHKKMYQAFKRKIDNDLHDKEPFETTYPLKDLKIVTKVTSTFSKMLQHGETEKDIEFK